MSLFTVVSIPLLIPFFQILFDRVQPTQTSSADSDISSVIKKYLHSAITAYGQEKTLIGVCLLIVVIFFFKNLFRYAALYFMTPIRNGIIYDIRKELFDKLIDLPLSFYSNERKGILLSGMTLDVQEIELSILNVIEVIFKSPIIMVGSILFMFYISPSLTLFVFVLVFFTAFIIGGIGKKLRAQSGDAQRYAGNLTALVEESLGGMRIVKAFNAETYLKNKFDTENLFYKGTLSKVINRRELSSPLSEFLGVSIVTVLMFYGSLLVFDGELKAETFFAFIFAFYQVIEPAKSFANAYFNIQKGSAALDRIDRIMQVDNEIINTRNPIKLENFSTDIRLEYVSFAYKDNTEWGLKNIHLTIKKGQMVALVGSSGSGKTTISDLLIRMYDPQKGKITIDGIDVKDIPIDHLRSLFGVVSQDPILFNDSVYNNIVFGASHTFTDQDIIEAAKAAHAHDFISQLPHGYNTNIGDRGVKLSGGQRQRLTIARAILRNPPILIMDEATSALDTESERLVQHALANIMKSRTSIVIAHRLSTIQHADLIVVLDKGEIKEVGTHDHLMSQKGNYYNLIKMQLL